MRSFYKNISDNRTADLCQLFSGGTRLTIHDGYKTVHRKEYCTWDDAISALKGYGEWENELTGTMI